MAGNLQELLEQGSEQLKLAGISEWQLDSRYLLLEAFHISMSTYLVKRHDCLADSGENKSCAKRYQEMLDRRSERIPLQYITGSQEFMGMEFSVNEAVLIPRQDTEDLVELVLKNHTAREISILDMCTGSGCIAVSLKKLGNYSSVTGSDISAEALKVAVENGTKHQCNVSWIQSDLFQDFDKEKDVFDVIVSNPPYIPTEVIKGLEPEVRDCEPMLALDGTDDGLFFYRKLADECRAYLKKGGSVYFEIGYDQGGAVRGLLMAAGFTGVEVVKDLPGLDRIVKGIYLGGSHV